MLVIIESPYTGKDDEETERNIRYARACMKDSLLRGESPLASHLLYTQPGILNDKIPEERKLGIQAGLNWAYMSEMSVFYIDFGYSKGMMEARAFYEMNFIPMVERKLTFFQW